MRCAEAFAIERELMNRIRMAERYRNSTTAAKWVDVVAKHRAQRERHLASCSTCST